MGASTETSLDKTKDLSDVSLVSSKSAEAFRTISEVAEDLDIPQHVLRFWETRFPQIKPLKRGGGRRYYRPDDVDLLKSIRHLLYGQGYTIKGVQRILKEEGVKAVQKIARSAGEQKHAVSTQKKSQHHVSTTHDEQGFDDAEQTDSLATVENLNQAHQQPISTGVAKKHAGAQLSRANAVTNTSIVNFSNVEVSDADRKLLVSAYQELAECRRLLSRVFSDVKNTIDTLHRNVA